MTTAQLIRFAQAYSRLGWAIGDQAVEILVDHNTAGMNRSAVQMIRELVLDAEEHLDDADDALYLLDLAMNDEAAL